MDVAINELSFQDVSSESDAELLRRLVRTLKALKDRIAHADRSVVRFRIADAWLYPRRLPGKTTIGDVRAILDDIDRGLCDCFFDYPSIPVMESPLFYHNNMPAHGLGYAHENKFLAVSIESKNHAMDELWMDSRHDEVKSGNVSNLWRSELSVCHLQTIAKHVRVLPRYVDPGHHEPKNKEYIKGKSHIPRGARELFRYSHSHDNVSWWVKCECNALHRFQGGDPVHWNGSTHRRAIQTIQDNEVPGVIREYWKRRTGVVDCGCR
jgi:hypothetical protein